MRSQRWHHTLRVFATSNFEAFSRVHVLWLECWVVARRSRCRGWALRLAEQPAGGRFSQKRVGSSHRLSSLVRHQRSLRKSFFGAGVLCLVWLGCRRFWSRKGAQLQASATSTVGSTSPNFTFHPQLAHKLRSDPCQHSRLEPSVSPALPSVAFRWMAKSLDIAGDMFWFCTGEDPSWHQLVLLDPLTFL